jgi:hypothetical protein
MKLADPSRRMHFTAQAASRRSQLTMRESRRALARGRKAIESSERALARSNPKTSR